jgi:hypothetical protein
MKDRISWINKNGKKILIANYSGLNNDQIKDVILELVEVYKTQPLKSILSITDLTNTYLTKSTFEMFKEMDAKTNQYDLKASVVGLNKAKKILLNLLNMFNKSEVKGFDSREEAIEWLVK